MKIADIEIGYDRPPAYVAEISCNHGGNLANAIRLIDAAKKAGATFVKFQCYEPSAMTLPNKFIIPDGPWAGRDLYELYEKAKTPYVWFPILAEVCYLMQMPWFASVFDLDGLDTLEAVGCPAYKIASCEIVDTELIKNVAATGKPVILSTGMASREEIRRAVMAVGASPHALILMHCIAGYPSAIKEAQLRTIGALKNSSGIDLIGISDHSQGPTVPVAATALGVVMIEKHLQLPDVRTEDAEFSMDRYHFRAMVDQCNGIWSAIHDHTLRIDSTVTGSEISTMWARRSLHALKDIEPGESFTRHNIGSIRPAGGLPSWNLPEVLTYSAARPIKAGEPILDSDLQKRT